MILLKYKELFIKYVFCSILLVVVMMVLSKVFYKKPVMDSSNLYFTSNINYLDDKTKIDVEYPRFYNDKINKIITDNLYSYIKEFKTHDINKTLEIKYDLYHINNYVNIQYKIFNSIDNIKRDNILLDLNNSSIAYIGSIYDEEYLKNEIYTYVNNKYSKDIYDKVISETINNYTYILSDDSMEVYFNNIENYPNIKINFNVNMYKNDNSIKKHKYIIFSYNDGPSEYTEDILNVLEKNNSSATFFMLGKNMKFYDSLVLKIFNSNSEVGYHGYSHNDLSNYSLEDIKNEISSQDKIFNEITNSNSKLFSFPYGKYNKEFNKLGLDIIKYDIDSKDWLVKDSKIIYNNIIKNACDGCVVLMHDTYKTSLDATELLIPELNKLGYEVVSVSEYKKLSK